MCVCVEGRWGEKVWRCVRACAWGGGGGEEGWRSKCGGGWRLCVGGGWRCVWLIWWLTIKILHAVFYVGDIRAFATCLAAVSWNIQECRFNGQIQTWRRRLINTLIWLDEKFHQFWNFFLDLKFFLENFFYFNLLDLWTDTIEKLICLSGRRVC